MEIRSVYTYRARVHLLPDSPGPLGPFPDPHRRVGVNVVFRGAVYSAFMEIGNREVFPGDDFDTVLILSQVAPTFHLGDAVDLSAGGTPVGTAEILDYVITQPS